MNKKGSFDDSFKIKILYFKMKKENLKKLKKFNTSNSNSNIFNSKNISTSNTSSDLKRVDKGTNMNNVILNLKFEQINNINDINKFYLKQKFYRKEIFKFNKNLTPINKNDKIINFFKKKKSLSGIVSPINNKKHFSNRKANSDIIDFDSNKKGKIKNEKNTQYHTLDSQKELKKNTFTKVKSGMKIINNSPLNTIKSYNLFCKKNNKLILEAIKYHLSLYWDNKFEIISDFFKKNKMSKLVNSEYIENFSYYIKNNFNNIDFNIPMNNIILNGIQFNYKIKTQNKLIDYCKINKVNSNKNDISKNIDIINEKVDDNKINNKNSINNIKKILNWKYKDLKNKQDFNYFHHQCGKIDTYNDSNLFINLSKQKKLYEKEKLELSTSNKNSIKLYNEKELNELKEELNKITNTKSNSTHKTIHSRLYEEIKEQFYNENLDYLPRKNNKLLEYIIFQTLKKKYTFHQAIIEKLQIEQKKEN